MSNCVCDSYTSGESLNSNKILITSKMHRRHAAKIKKKCVLEGDEKLQLWRHPSSPSSSTLDPTTFITQRTQKNRLGPFTSRTVQHY